MTGEKENRNYYRKTFQEVHASEDLLRKVEAMGKEYHKKNGVKIWHKGLVAVATLTLALISSNIISYAATGSPWIITVTTSDGRELLTEPGTYELEDGIVYTVKDLVNEETAFPITESGAADKTGTGKEEAENAVSEDAEVEASSENSVNLLETPQEGEEVEMIRTPSSDSYLLKVPQEEGETGH